MQTIVLYLCYIVLILLFSTAYNTSLIYCFVIWCLHTNKRRPCSSTLSGHPSSSCCAGTSVTRLKPRCVAEPVAGAMAGALLPENKAKNDGDWVPKRSSFICVCVANMTGKRFFSSMTLQPFGPRVYFMNYTAKENLGLFIYSFQSTSTVFQF